MQPYSKVISVMGNIGSGKSSTLKRFIESHYNGQEKYDIYIIDELENTDKEKEMLNNAYNGGLKEKFEIQMYFLDKKIKHLLNAVDLQSQFIFMDTSFYQDKIWAKYLFKKDSTELKALLKTIKIGQRIINKLFNSEDIYFIKVSDIKINERIDSRNRNNLVEHELKTANNMNKLFNEFILHNDIKNIYVLDNNLDKHDK